MLKRGLLIFILLLLIISCNNNTTNDKINVGSEEQIAINQIGYLPNAIKEVRISSAHDVFYIKVVSSEKILFTGSFTTPKSDAASGNNVYVGDFSDLQIEGEYFVDIPELGQSAPFIVNKDVYIDLYDAVEKMFYFQRCGVALTEDKAGIWSHQACHTREAQLYGTDKMIDVSGGWHDAGDYGRYVGPGAKTVADLILSENLTDQLKKEIMYELDWMLKMQDQNTGGVYHKVTTANFIGSVMPDQNFDNLIISPISSTATGAFAAVMAMSSRIFKDFDHEFSEVALNSALNAWSWLESNTDIQGFRNPEGISTGEYGDYNDGDERFWASVELFLTTEDEKFNQYAIDSYSHNKWAGLGWADVGTYGILSYIFTDSSVKDEHFKNLLADDFLISVNELSDLSSNDGYGISLGIDYQWGSNQIVADNGVKLLYAYKLTENRVFSEQAMNHINYLLGSNSLGQSYVSGFGDKSIQNPHHRPSTATGRVIPGMLAGGPNKNLQDPLAKSELSGKPPAKCFIDAEPSYSTNEVTIYWNSPLYRLLTPFVN